MMDFNGHEQVELTDPWGNDSRICEGMSELVQLLWSHGIQTRITCSGDPKFADQTDWEARKYLAKISMVRSERSMAFVQGLLMDSHFFMAEKVLWEISFDRVPRGDRKDENRIHLRFPNQDIPGLVNYIHMKADLMSIHLSDAPMILDFDS